MSHTLYVVGIGPGGLSEMTPKARAAIEKSQAVYGYKAYIELIKSITQGKEIYSSPMRSESKRCEEALSKAKGGYDVALVSSGDPCVYGMASLALEIRGEDPEVDIEVISGVTAALSGAARLGSPMSGDFAVISLSDLMTPWSVIEKRLKLASEADFVIAIYNPSSAKRKDNLMKACDIVLMSQSPETPCGIVRNIGREGEECSTLSLKELRDSQVDMFTTVFIGNSNTKAIAGKLVTPRGYIIDEVG